MILSHKGRKPIIGKNVFIPLADYYLENRQKMRVLIKQKYPNGALSIDSNALVIYAEK